MKKLLTFLCVALLVSISIKSKAQQLEIPVSDSIKYNRSTQWPSLSFEPALSGKVAGVRIVGKSGQTGSAYDINIRNTMSVTSQSNRILYIIDGIAVNSGDLGRNISNNIFNSLAPADIESVVVIKDAAATALYGEAASNGAVVITTRQGCGKKINVRFNTSIGFSPSFAHKNYETVSADMNKELMYEQHYNSSIQSYSSYLPKELAIERAQQYAQRLTDEYIPKTAQLTNWENILYRTPVYQDYNLSIYGNINDNTRYYLSGAYTKDPGRVSINDADRYSTRFNFAQKFLKIFEWNSNISYAKTSKTGMSDEKDADNLFYMERAILLDQWPAYNSDGSLYDRPYIPNRMAYSYYNPLYTNQFRDNNSETEHLNINESLKATLFNELTVETRFGYEDLKYNEYLGYTAQYPSEDIAGWNYNTDTKISRISSYNYIGWNKQIANKHNIWAKGGFEYEKYTYSQVIHDVLYDVSNNQIGLSEKTGKSKDSKNSVIANVGYNFNNKYTIQASFRHEALRTILEIRKTNGIFAVSGVWNIGNEEFLRGISWISSLDFKASYSHLSTNRKSTDDKIYIIDNRYCGYNKADIGIDGKLFNNRMHINANYFISDLDMNNIPMPNLNNITGEIEINYTPYTLSYKGLELSVAGEIISTKDWNWTLGINLAKINSKLKADTEPDMIFTSGKARYVPKTGISPNSFYGYKFAGVDPENGYSLWHMQEDNNSKHSTTDITKASQQIIGCADPKAYGGFQSQLSWRNISMDLNFIYSFGGDVYDSRKSQSNVEYPKYSADMLNRWQQPGDITNIPMLASANYPINSNYSDLYVYKNNYIRLKSLNIAYTLPASISKKMKMEELKLSFSATNLLTFSNNKDFDPEVASIYGNIGWSLPISRTYMLGLSLTF
ncbi:MAG: TonB-dependent receptor plug domain-containing protein [Bacteroidales bacterium]|nr:TonB-dependent receptor plug domain-containing protein [Bacteroidales bacterium]